MMTATMRVWHIPQVPMDPFFVNVSDIDDAIRIINILADYDIFQFENKIKPDYCNMSGLEVLEGDEWLEWENEDGMTIDDVIRERGACPARSWLEVHAAEEGEILR